MLPGAPLQHWLGATALRWIQLALATPVVLWGGWPFFVRAWHSVLNRSPNMFTLIGMGTGTAYLFSLVATLAPDVFPESFRGHGGGVENAAQPAQSVGAQTCCAHSARPNPPRETNESRSCGIGRSKSAPLRQSSYRYN